MNPTAGVFDGCVVFNDVPEVTEIICPPDKTVFIASEPPAVKCYHREFINQFRSIVTCDSETPHPRKLHWQQGYHWHFGVAQTPTGPISRWDYDTLSIAPPPEKTKLISAIVSDKTATPGQRQRHALVARLHERFGEQIDIFGRGVRDLPDKAEGILPYRYHLALENSEYPDYWTEKLADSFLGRAYPLYWGCPNIERYFPADALTRIDIYDPDAAVATIEQVIAERRFEVSTAARETARSLVLNTYNFFVLAADVTLPFSSETPVRLSLRPEHVYRRRHTRFRMRLSRLIASR